MLHYLTAVLSRQGRTDQLRQAAHSLARLEAFADALQDQTEDRLASLHDELTDSLADVDALLRGGVR